jgi:redox-sensitive bicupin YhaK (pirin superfamily)
VRLRRAFGSADVPAFDPFLMLDDFRSTEPRAYQAGFPWHPHRGIETITYLIEGSVEHGDSIGNRGVIGPGDVQWMTAGSGIVHQEMPVGDSHGRMGGFQLWANLPAAQKMTDPRYRDVRSADIPVIRVDDALVRIVAGSIDGVVGPVHDIMIEPEYFDVTIDSEGVWTHPTSRGHTAFAYLFEGGACFSVGDDPVCAEDGMLVLFADGDGVEIRADEGGARFLFLSGQPLDEPVAWGGPIVMNTQAELERAFDEYRSGTFIKTGSMPRDMRQAG